MRHFQGRDGLEEDCDDADADQQNKNEVDLATDDITLTRRFEDLVHAIATGADMARLV